MAATWGLFLAWAVHDAEELLTMGGWVDRARPRLNARFPRVPDRVWDRLRVNPAQARFAVGAMGAIVAAAAARGARTGGRSRFYQATLAGFGLHSVTHIAQAATLRGYTPGAATAPLVVAPFSVWAWRQLGRAGVRGPARTAAVSAAALLPVATVACHALARTLAPKR
ncbi:HXXEE domain-containing protein [Planosporangium thailandense]|uniref:HXXEE domain-containing protein n=1 Tax=Planosporangium thailandense TaxID=765197 RepID=A0ABX0Y576_9ACTN|nr:HXXEE domain-containing protein [Planosporangium thailandense]NJC72489.1 HXXEE domain-containing protein [Planosporangium thailandense]